MTTNSFGSSAPQAEIMIRVITYLISGCKLSMRIFSNSCLIFVLWTFLVSTHLQGGKAVNTCAVIHLCCWSFRCLCVLLASSEVSATAPQEQWKLVWEIVCSRMIFKIINGLCFYQKQFEKWQSLHFQRWELIVTFLHTFMYSSINEISISLTLHSKSFVFFKNMSLSVKLSAT